MNESQEEIKRLREEIQALRAEIDGIKGDIAENSNMLKSIINLLRNRR